MPTAVYVPKGMDHTDLTLDNIETLSEKKGCKTTCQRTQQLPTLLAQQCWQMLRPIARI